MSELNSLVLMGCKHCGKTTHGKQLAHKFNLDFFDTDAVLEQIVGMSFRDYYKTAGVAKFMQAEEEACKKIAEENAGKRIIIATGGGICDNAPALNHLRVFGKFVFLELDLEFSISRIENKAYWDKNESAWKNLPAYVTDKNPQTMEEVHQILLDKYKQRFEQYRKIADITVSLKNQTPDANLELILKAIN